MKIIATLGGLVVAAVVALAGAGPAVAADVKCGLSNGQAATGDPIPVGGIVSVTGPDDFSSSGKAADAFFKCVNANGGINGRPIAYTMLDDGWKPEQSAQAAAKLVKDLKVVAIAGNMSFVDCGANEGLYEQEGVLVVAGVGVPQECFHSRNYAPTNMGPRLSNIGAATYVFNANPGKVKRIACIVPAVPGAGTWTCDGVAEWAKKHGAEVTTLAIDPATLDATSVILQAMAAKADFIDISMPKGLAVPLFAAAEEQDLRDKALWGGPASLFDVDFPKAIGPYWDGKVVVDMEFNALDSTQPDNQNWLAVMEKYGNASDPRDTFSQAGYLSARVVTQALLTLDPAKIDRAAATKAITDVKGFKSDILCAPWYFGPGNEHNANHSGPVAIVKDGKFDVQPACIDIEDSELEIIKTREAELGLAK